MSENDFFHFFFATVDEKKSEKVLDVLESIERTDSIVVKENSTGKELVNVTDADDDFDRMVDIYNLVHDLSWKEKSSSIGTSYLTLSFGQKKRPFSKSVIFEVEKEHLSLVPISYTTEVKTVQFYYSPDNNTYIFALTDINQLISVDEGLEKFMDLALMD